MAASGFAGLGYQIVWTQQCALWLGHESAAVLAVVAAFFGGLAVGALALGPRIETSTRPVRWYAGCELVIASWSLLLALGHVAVQHLDARHHWRAADAGVAVDGGVLRNVPAAACPPRRRWAQRCRPWSG